MPVSPSGNPVHHVDAVPRLEARPRDPRGDPCPTPPSRPDATEALDARAPRERILVIDGAMGTLIQGHQLGEADYRGERFADPATTSAATPTCSR